VNEEDQEKNPGRTSDGRFAANGPSPNPRGRPRKAQRTYTDRQIRHDILDLMEEKIELKIQGKVKRIPIIQGIYWKMFQKALEGDAKMILASAELRHDLVQAHMRENPELVKELESHERELRRHGASESKITELLNELRGMTKRV
jgi:hypothetical protein